MCKVIDYGQDTHAAAIDELIGDEVERPVVVGPLRDEHRRPRAERPFAPATAANHEAFLPIEPKQRLTGQICFWCTDDLY